MDDIDKTFNRLKRVDYETMVLIIRKNGLSEYTMDDTGRLIPSLYVKDRYTQVCLENGWSLEEFVNELDCRMQDMYDRRY